MIGKKRMEAQKAGAWKKKSENDAEKHLFFMSKIKLILDIKPLQKPKAFLSESSFSLKKNIKSTKQPKIKNHGMAKSSL